MQPDCHCLDCHARFAEEDTVPGAVQAGADVERLCPECCGDYWVRDEARSLRDEVKALRAERKAHFRLLFVALVVWVLGLAGYWFLVSE